MSHIPFIGTVVIALTLSSATRADDKRVPPAGGEKGTPPRVLRIGAVGYAQWQISDNQINVNTTSRMGQSIVNQLEDTRSRIYAAGPGIQLLTKFGLFELRCYDEFAAKATPSSQQLMFSVTLADNPWS